MNILYIGPYRQNDDVGYLSRLYLKELIDSNHKITSRPIYNTSDVLNQEPEWINSAENNLFDDYSLLIQHANLYYASYSKRFSRNILIPILPNTTKINNHEHIEKINLFDQTIVTNSQEETQLVRSGVISKIRAIDCPIDIELARSVDKKFGLAVHDNNHKFYFIGNYKKDIDIIQKILLSFFLAFRADIRISIIMLLEGDPQDQQNISSISKDMKTKLRIPAYDNTINELYIFQKFSDFDNMVLHNTCDTFINLNHNLDIEKQKAVFFGNNIIDISNTNYVEVPYSGNGSKPYDIGDNVCSVITNSLKDQFLYYNKKNRKKEPNQNPYKKTLLNAL